MIAPLRLLDLGFRSDQFLQRLFLLRNFKLPDKAVDARYLPAKFPLMQGIIHMPDNHLKPEIQIFPGKFISFCPELRQRKILERILHKLTL